MNEEFRQRRASTACELARLAKTASAEVHALCETGLLVPRQMGQDASAKWQRQKDNPSFWLALGVRNQFRADQVAAESGISERHLERLWPQWFGVGPREWLHWVRMTLAAFWLWQGERGTAVAGPLRYRTSGHFYRAFRDCLGVPTKQFVAETRSLSWTTAANRCRVCRKMVLSRPTSATASAMKVGCGPVRKLSPCQLEVMRAANEGLSGSGTAEPRSHAEERILAACEQFWPPGRKRAD